MLASYRLVVALGLITPACFDAGMVEEDPFMVPVTTTDDSPPATSSVDDGQPDTDSASSSPGDESGSDGGSTGDMPPPLTDSGESSGGPASCGNAMMEGDEECDLSDLGGQTCLDFGFMGGELSCFVNCMGISTDGCYICGNGILEGEEDCEGGMVPVGLECNDLGFDDGPVTCGADCFYDTSECSTCGNAMQEGLEPCDGDDLGGATCTSIGFEGGTLACAAAGCIFDFAGCTGSNLSCAELLLGNTSPQTIMGTTVGEDDDFTQTCGANGGPDLLMVFIAPSAGSYTFDTAGTAFDTVLSVHEDCDGAVIGCNDDAIGLQSQLIVPLAASQQVVIAMSGYNGNSGAFTFNLSGP